MKNLRIDLVIVLCLYLFLIACTNNRLNINVSNVQVAPVQLKHFDKDLFSLRADNIEQQISELQKNTLVLQVYSLIIYYVQTG